MENEQIGIILNGESATVPPGASLTRLVEILTLNPGQVAVELNGQIIKREQWDDCLLKSGDRVEVVHFVGGGESNV